MATRIDARMVSVAGTQLPKVLAEKADAADVAYLTSALDLGDVSGSVVLDLAESASFAARATGPITLQVSNAAPGKGFVLALTQDGTGARAITLDPDTFLSPIGPFALTPNPGATDIITGLALADGVLPSIQNAVSPLRNMALLDQGVSIDDGGDGAAEVVEPVIASPGAGGTLSLRRVNLVSNGGAAMAWTLPAAAQNGAYLWVRNVDAVASATISAPAGVTVEGGASVAVVGGQIVKFRYDGAGAWRCDGLSIAPAPVYGIFTPTMTFATPGDLAVAYTTQTGRYVRTGRKVWIQAHLICVPTFTTASSSLYVGGLPAAQQAGVEATLDVQRFDTSTNTAWPNGSAAQMKASINAGETRLRFYGVRSGAGRVAASIGHVPSGATLTLSLSGTYETD
jgi:hypothetical protein